MNIFCKGENLKNFKKSYVFNKTLVLYIVLSKCGSNNKTIFKEKKSIKNSWFN